MKIFNHTSFSQSTIESFSYLGFTVSKWRQRNIKLYQHPTEPQTVISVGTTFDNEMMVIAAEPKSGWQTALDYAGRGEIYVSE